MSLATHKAQSKGSETELIRVFDGRAGKFVFVCWAPAQLFIKLIYTDIVDASTCSPNCLNSTETSVGPSCNETSGECLYGCVPGYTGTQCLISCGENCVNCSIR